MKKQEIAVRTNEGIVRVNGYVDRGVGIHRDICNEKEWVVTDLASGLGCFNKHFATRKEAEANIEGALKNIENVKGKDPERYEGLVKGFDELTGKSNTNVKTESEGKKMAKTNAKAKASAKADNNKALEKENKALKKELEILKKQLDELTRVEKTSIDTFDVEGYMASRDNMHRITEELVEAIGNTKGLKFVFKNANKEVVPFSGTEWLYVSGETEADTKERKDIFKAMSFKWSAPEKAWVLAPYPIRSKKAWGAKKARKAMANA